MLDLAIHTTRVQFFNADLPINGYLAKPAGEGPFAAVIVLQEIFGVNAHIRAVTERLAQAGYVALAPNLYQRLDPNFDVGYTPADIELGKHYKAQTTAAELLSDITAAITYLRSLSTVKPDSIGTIGFCFGGHVAYLAATLPDIKATASFYGAGITHWTPGGDQPTLTCTAEIPGKIYAFFGTQDASIPAEQVAQIEAELHKYQIHHRIFRYCADHGFCCDQRASYNPEAAADAWQHVYQLFQEKL
ncbi:MAG TPA: dienelactone hydrolase family protein [Candidatus Caenarcaniphilales bacterium]